VVAFRELFLPVPQPEPVLIDGFAAAGRYLAHVIVLDRVTRTVPAEPINDATVLPLRPDLLVGTSRNFKDDGKGRPSPTADYHYIPFTDADYDEMIDAGANYFGVQGDQVDWVRHRPVFYRGPGAFPEDWYRSNYMPIAMFSDEPMVRLSWQLDIPPQLSHPQQMASFLESRVRHIYATIHDLAPIQRVFPTPLGLSTRDHIHTPTWETEYQTAFYQLAGGAAGIVHEGRYVREGYGWHPTALFGPGLEVTPREMLQCVYAFLRGAARAFDGDWGTSIYGQSDPNLRVEALTLAYDMGAKYLWFWTSDHDHHMPYPDQLALTRALIAHADAHPRDGLDRLRDRARVGIVFPAGYTLSWGDMFNQPTLGFERINHTGTAYREVVAAAMWEGVLCAKQGVSFDFTVDHAGLADLGYEELRIVGEDASVTRVPLRVSTRPVVPDVGVELGGASPLPSTPVPDDALTAIPVRAGQITIDGQLDDWADGRFLIHQEAPSGGGAWDGSADFAAAIAFAYDASFLYVAARVTDDQYDQPYYGWEMWNGDSVQIAFDPMNEPVDPGYTLNQHEIGFGLADGRPVAWRWNGRRGQPACEMSDVRCAIRLMRGARPGLVYEAAIPLSELAPLAPAITPVVGFAVTFNDGDNGQRETFHETSPGAMTEGKHPVRFRKLYFPPPDDDARQRVRGPRAWAAVIWHDTVAPVGGTLTAELATCAWDEREITLTARMTPLEPLAGLAGSASATCSATAAPQRHPVRITADTEPGRYRLTLTANDDTAATLARESMTVFIYPK